MGLLDENWFRGHGKYEEVILGAVCDGDVALLQIFMRVLYFKVFIDALSTIWDLWTKHKCCQINGIIMDYTLWSRRSWVGLKNEFPNQVFEKNWLH